MDEFGHDYVDLLEKKIYMLRNCLEMEGLYSFDEKEEMMEVLKELIAEFTSLQLDYGDEGEDDENDNDGDGPSNSFKFRLFLN
jgi:hypothetical protein